MAFGRYYPDRPTLAYRGNRGTRSGHIASCGRQFSAENGPPEAFSAVGGRKNGLGELKIVPQGHEPAQNGENRVATGLERLKNGLGTGNNHDPDTPRRSGREKREISGGAQPKTGIFTANGRQWTQMGTEEGDFQQENRNFQENRRGIARGPMSEVGGPKSGWETTK